MQTTIKIQSAALVFMIGPFAAAQEPSPQAAPEHAPVRMTLPKAFYSNAHAGKVLDRVLSEIRLNRPIKYRFEGEVLCLGPYLDSKFASELAQRLAQGASPKSNLSLKVLVVDLGMHLSDGDIRSIDSVTIEGRLDDSSGHLQFAFRTSVKFDPSYGVGIDRSVLAAKLISNSILQEFN